MAKEINILKYYKEILNQVQDDKEKEILASRLDSARLVARMTMRGVEMTAREI